MSKMPSIPFKMPSLRQKQSKATMTNDNELHEEGVKQRTPRKQAMQDFLKTTGANLKNTGAHLRANLKAQSAKLPTRTKTRADKEAEQPPTKGRDEVPSFDINDDVLDRLMGPPKAEGTGKKQSENFLIRQRIRASSRAAASPGISPLSGRSQAEQDRKPLSAEEIRNLFVGAPYFSVERVQDGPNKPRVTFKDRDIVTSAKRGTDYSDLGHISFGASTLHFLGTRESGEQTPSRSQGTLPDARNDTFLEVPNMLSANGLDPGTVGFEHFLQMPVADSSILPHTPTFFDRRKLLYSDSGKLGLRKLNMETLIDRLTELGTLRTAKKQNRNLQQPWTEAKSSEMGDDMFANLLDPELGTTSTGTGNGTLITQIAALRKVLNDSELWYDFSRVEWRIRVGQILWASQEQEAPQLDEDRQPSDRDVLLLQITLAAELLVRLDALEASNHTLPTGEGVSDEEKQTRKEMWDVLLAERFLDNLIISAKAKESSTNKRSSLFSVISFFTAHETSEEAEQSVQPLLFPKNEGQQLAGLLYFAEAIQWPHVEEVRRELEAKLAPPALPTPRQHRLEALQDSNRPVSGVSQYVTPLSSPMLPSYSSSVKRNRTNDFANATNQQQRRPGLSRTTTAQSLQLLPASASGAGQDAFEVGGWLSRSWLSGLTLPGEPASHFLISTVLENSPHAVDVLGDSANLYGGFVYAGSSFWSKSCVVGRVLAASKGAKDCMGWLFIPSAPEGQSEGWVDLEVKDAPCLTAEPRIKDPETVAKSSDPLQESNLAKVQAGDFTTPVDGPPVMGNEVKCNGVSFTTPQTSSEHAKSAEALGASGSSTNIAYLNFTSPINTKLAEVSVPLTYDVLFVASYPCYPARAVKRRTSSKPEQSQADGSKAVSPVSPATPEALKPTDTSKDYLEARSAPHPTNSRPRDSARTSGITFSLRDNEKELPSTPAHPLHIDFHLDIIPAASLLKLAPETRPRALSTPEDPGKTKAATDINEDVVVLDCRGAEDLELLARAWCAKVGENAIIGRSGRTCLACCVREARALGICVVIRT